MIVALSVVSHCRPHIQFVYRTKEEDTNKIIIERSPSYKLTVSNPNKYYFFIIHQKNQGLICSIKSVHWRHNNSHIAKHPPQFPNAILIISDFIRMNKKKIVSYTIKANSILANWFHDLSFQKVKTTACIYTTSPAYKV